MSYRIGMVELAGRATPVVELDGTVFRVADLAPDAPPSVQAMLPDWPRWHTIFADGTRADDVRPGARPVDLAAARWLPPIEAPPKLVCIGINYRDHIAEMGKADLPEVPYSFLRPGTCLAAHGQAIALPVGPRMIDWEAELGVVIGRRAHRVRGADALAAVGFYTVVNDLSARDWIESAPFVGIDWVMQKAWDGFQPTGPWLTPAAFVPDPQALPIRLTVNGVAKQESNTAQMVFGVREIVEHLSAIMTLEPGDLIATGTPAGVGFGRRPREFLHAGDEVEVTVGPLGTLRNRLT